MGWNIQGGARYLCPRGFKKARADIRVGEFRNDATESRVYGQLVGEIEQALDDLLGMVKGVAANVFGDAVDVIERFVRPDQGWSHLLRRSLACSWVRPRPS